MGLFDSFPLSNAYAVNLDWIMKKIRDVEEFVKNYAAVNKVEYAGVWDITKQYPQWALVTDGETSWLSNKPVPVGIPLENAEYWQKLADLDPRIAGIIVSIDKLKKDIADTNNHVTTNSTEIIKLGEDLKTVENLTSVVSVLNFGAKGDGTTDDFQAFSRTISACKPHGVVVIPYTGNSYVINGTINVDKPIKIVGLYAGMEPYGAKTTDISAETMEKPLIEHKTDVCFNCTCLGIEFNNISIRTARNGFKFTGGALTSGSFGRYIHLSDCTVYCTSDNGTGFNFENCFRVLAENCNAFGGHRPFVLSSLTSSSFVSCWARNFSNTGWTILNSVYTSLVSCACDALENSSGKHGYYISGCGTVNLVACGVENTDDAMIIETTKGVSASVYCVAVGADTNSAIIQLGNNTTVGLAGCVSSVNRKIAITGTGSIVNISTCDRFTHLIMGGQEYPINYGFWSSINP